VKLHDIVGAYCPLIEDLVCRSKGVEYKAMFLQPDLKSVSHGLRNNYYSAVQQAYVLGIVERSHLSCLTSLARAARWLVAADQLAEVPNILAFSAALRGFLESAADSFDLMEKLPSVIARSLKYFYIVLNDPNMVDKTFVNLEAIEGLLIHYAFAGRQARGGNSLPYHQNKSNAEYIRKIQDFGVPGASDLYSEMCELTHPASPSVMCFVDQSDRSIVFNPERDNSLIYDVLKKYKETIVLLSQYSINPALMTLALIGRLIPEWPAPSDDSMRSVGSTSKMLWEFDQFLEKYKSGNFDLFCILEEMS
jgi:hypothetical protein